MSSRTSTSRPTVFAIWLILAGVVGWFAAFELTLERFHQLASPGSSASCDFNIVVQCGKNLESWQGALFGFPNPILGLTGWVAPIVVGAALLAGARFARWFWMLFWLGVAGAFALVVWLIVQSVFVIGTLCPWCMVTWAVTIPTFYAVTLHLVRAGLVPASARARKGAATLMGWTPVLTVVSYAIVALIAQLRLDWIGTL
ncbi:vitamin K epoxide reductase family protein [Microbacterium sp.]|uniref:vitamin K epoxide reductase family protein n=1 Tax=Microbacterium sp. TaxID=51671 RepID=UPI0032214E1A